MRFILSFSLLATYFLAGSGRAVEPQANEFFEKKIRPVLTQHCLSCHSVEAEKIKKLKGGLYLDTREGILQGGESGPSVVVGKPKESLLIKAMHFDGDTQMPPKGKLADSILADFEKWVAMGLPDPRTNKAEAKKKTGMTLEEGRQFWAYKPVRRPPVPTVKKADWARSDIDRFILARLEAKGLAPVADVDPRLFVRRLYFDLIGLPPSPEEVEAFLMRVSERGFPRASDELADRLLASPQFGERWGRHWLDIARYGESLTLRGLILKEAWRYRDYVVDSFNRDVPFDQLVREQIAGDLLPSANLDQKRRQIIATAFLAMGNTNLEEQDKIQLRMDVVDEQLDVITKGFLAQTVTCARCHDHKFDPIPTQDYYALAGILRNAKAMEHANVSKWIEQPLPMPANEEALFNGNEKTIADLRAKIKAAKAGSKSVVKVMAVKDVAGIVVDDGQAKKVGDWQHSVSSGFFIGEGYIHDRNADKGEKTLTFQPELKEAGRYEIRLAYSPGNSRSKSVPVTVFSADGEKTLQIDMQQSPGIDNRFVSLGEYRVEKNGQCYVIVSTEGTTGHVTADATVFISLDQKKEKPKADTSAQAKKIQEMESEVQRLVEKMGARPMVLTVVEEKKIEETRVHVRGNVHNLGTPAPRGFLRVAQSGQPIAFSTKESGRKELADWIASPSNPLTARVYVNRVWHWLLGEGLVRTADNFGTTGELPSHPELLDYLATRFVEEGWSTKRLIRAIVLSHTYQLASSDRKGSELLKADPENRLFGRANRRRLEAECIRDAMLAVSGQLSPGSTGPTYPANLSSDYSYKEKPSEYRRSLYLPVFRNALSETLTPFDFADSSVVMGNRNLSTIAPQALFLMNHPFPREQARQAAERLLEQASEEDAQRIARAYQMALGRLPSPGEEKVAKQFLTQTPDPQVAWTSFFHALFASADFRYVD